MPPESRTVEMAARPEPDCFAALGWMLEDREKLRHVRSARWLLVVASWADLRRTTNKVDGRIVVAADLGDTRLIQRLHWIHAETRPHPLFLATRLEPPNLRHLKDVIVDEVLDWDRPVDEWNLDLKRHAADGDFRLLAEDLRQHRHLRPVIRIALIRLALADPPILTVKALADSVKYTPNGLRRNFMPLLKPWRLEDLVDWFVLLRYGWRKGKTERSASGFGKVIEGPHPRTLDAMARRLLGEPRRWLPSRPTAVDHAMLREIMNFNLDG